MVALLLASSGCKKSDKKQGNDGPPEIEVAYPEVDSVTLHKSYPGTLFSPSKAVVVGRVNGMILSQNYEDGSYVNQGQVLFTIESTEYRNAVAQAESALSTAKAQHDYYTRQYAALTKALKSDAVSQMDVEQAKSNMEQAAASMRDAQARLSTARTNLSYCTVTAPISGLASASILSKGDYVGGGASPVTLTTIYDENVMAVKFHIEDSQYEDLLARNNGLDNPLFRKVPLTFQESLPTTYTADLNYESPTIDPSTGTLLIKGKIANTGGELKDGMFCTANLPYGSEPKAILVKDASIGTDQLGKYVYVVNDSDKVVYTHIEIGELYQDSLRIVTKGLSPRQRYVTKALQTVREGEKVKPVTAAQKK